MYKKILVPLDGSLRAEEILPHVESLALRLTSEILLLYVDAASDLILERDEVADANAFLEAGRRRIRKHQLYLQAIADKWRSIDIATRVLLAVGDVVTCIVDTATREAVDLVAMTSHGQTGSERTFYGGVAASVLNRIDRPLLLIRSRYPNPARRGSS